MQLKGLNCYSTFYSYISQENGVTVTLYFELNTVYAEIFATCNFHDQATDQDFRV